jgi:tRNA A37 threonylcarbamoyladenosine biosynthesis protein TsaE
MTAAQTSVADWLSFSSSLRSLPLDQEAMRIYEHAYQIGKESEAEGLPRISFTTLLIALMRGENETSKWFNDKAKANGPEAVLVEFSKGFNAAKEVPPFSLPPSSIQLSNDQQLLTVSARAVLETAEQWAHRVGGTDIGVRHLVASYVLNPPPNHRLQMQLWNFQESKWRPEFFEWVAQRYTAEQWTDASHRPAPSKVATAFEQQKIRGADLAFPGGESSTAILEKAAKFHSGRKDPWLRLQTVFFALVETARANNAIRKRIEPIWNAVDAAKEQYEAERNSFLQAGPPDTDAEFSSADISSRVLNVLETARELAVATRHDGNQEVRVSVLHLAGALISRRVDSDEELTTLGLNPQTLRNELIEHAAKENEPVEVWREALGEEDTLQAGRPVDLNSDEPEAVVRLDEEWKSDPLSIRPDVEAFAALLASKSLEPPLSIGLFGPWGSGKTTFLRRLQRAVQRRADVAQDKNNNQKPTPFVGNVVHVDFNAWHFAEGALTSSLVDTIFRALSAYIKDDQIIAGTAWSKLKLEALESTQRRLAAAEAVKQAAQAAVTSAETELATAKKTAADETTTLRAAVKGVWKTTQNTLQTKEIVKESGVLEAIGDTVNSAGELQAKLNSIRTRPARLLNDLGWGRSIIFAALVLVVPLAVAWVVARVSGEFSQVLSTMTAVLVMIGAWLRSATKAVDKVDQAIARVAEEYDQQIAADEGVRDATQRLENAQVSAETAELCVQAAREALAKAQAEAANASLPAQMLQLVSSRIEDQTYNKELTTLSLARADLQTLSIILRDQRNPAAKTDAQTTPSATTQRPVDRVILYIDDLDRCRPEDVVRVLQLVHMLLAFELFVVVVAVDARWVEEALINSYAWLSTDADADAAPVPTTNGHTRQRRSKSNVTPQDYLEKIFQISFWLEPMTSARAASYLGSLVRSRAREASPDGTTPETSVETIENKIDIAGIELDYMRALAAYVGPSPRRVKRLVNAYRLIKARLSEAQLKTFLQKEGTDDQGGLRSGPYQLVIGLLVIGTGAPATSVQILRELSECDPGDKLPSVIERFQAHDKPDWAMAAKVIETLMRTQNTDSVSELRGWARKVGRFLLNSPSADVIPTRSHKPPVQAPAIEIAENGEGVV